MPRVVKSVYPNNTISSKTTASSKSRVVLSDKVAKMKDSQKKSKLKDSKNMQMKGKGLKRASKPTATPARETGSDSESERAFGFLSTGKRTSRRKTLAVDMNKPINIVWPSDDIKARLNLSDKEYKEFLLVLNSDDRLVVDEDNEESHFGDMVPILLRDNSMADTTVVYTPGVSASSSLSFFAPEPNEKDTSKPSTAVMSKRKRIKKETVSVVSQDGPVVYKPSEFSKYLDYDADSEDEKFLDSLSSKHEDLEDSSAVAATPKTAAKKSAKKKRPAALISPDAFPEEVNGVEAVSSPLTCVCFERMISILERELEVEKIFLKEKIRGDLQGRVTKDLISDGYELVTYASAFIGDKKPNSKAGQNALKKAYDIAVSTEAARSRKASTQAAVMNVSSDVPLPGSSKGRGNCFEGVLKDSGNTDQNTGLSFPAPAVHQLLGIMAKARRGKREATGNSKSSAENVSPRTALNAASSNSSSGQALFSSEHLKFLVGRERAMNLLWRVYLDWYPDVNLTSARSRSVWGKKKTVTIRGKGSVGKRELAASERNVSDHGSQEISDSDEHDYPPSLVSAGVPSDVLSMLSQVYKYWTHKRAGRVDSLLRCYHNFMMDKWHQQASMPPLPEDFNIEELKRGHYQLHRLRHDLDRARLIIDRVRRREKLKKELVKTAGDSYDKLSNLVQQFNELPLTSSSSSGPSLKKGINKRGTKAKPVDPNALWREVNSMAKRIKYSLMDDEPEDDVAAASEEELSEEEEVTGRGQEEDSSVDEDKDGAMEREGSISGGDDDTGQIESVAPVKRGPGRPRKNTTPDVSSTTSKAANSASRTVSRKTGKRSRNDMEVSSSFEKSEEVVEFPRKRGRPRKHPILPMSPPKVEEEEERKGASKFRRGNMRGRTKKMVMSRQGTRSSGRSSGVFDYHASSSDQESDLNEDGADNSSDEVGDERYSSVESLSETASTRCSSRSSRTGSCTGSDDDGDSASESASDDSAVSPTSSAGGSTRSSRSGRSRVQGSVRGSSGGSGSRRSSGDRSEDGDSVDSSEGSRVSTRLLRRKLNEKRTSGNRKKLLRSTSASVTRSQKTQLRSVPVGKMKSQLRSSTTSVVAEKVSPSAVSMSRAVVNSRASRGPRSTYTNPLCSLATINKLVDRVCHYDH